MFKREWTVFGVLSACTVAVTLFSLIYTRSDGTKVEWLSYVVIIAIVVTVAFLAMLLYFSARQKFDILLQREGFVASKQYKWDKHLVCLDFDSQRLANTYLSTKPIVPFSDVLSFRIETYRIGAHEELPEDQCFLSFVISIKKEGFDYEYQYIPVFEVKVDSADVAEVKEITQELTDKYPELTDMMALQTDVKKILEINAANGVHSNIQSN